MKKEYIRLHWTTILKSIRSYWIVLASPLLRIVLQYVITGNAETILLSDIVIFTTILAYAFIKWFNTKIYFKTNSIIVKSGVFLKSYNKISISRLTSIYFKRSMLDFLLNSAVCYISIEASANIETFKFNYRDTKDIIVVNGGDITTLKTPANKKRFLLMPTLIFCFVISTLVIKMLLYGKLAYYDAAFFIALTIVDLYYGYVCYHNYLRNRIKIDNSISFYGTRGLSTIKHSCSKNMVGIIKIYQTPTDRRYKTCKAKFIELSNGGTGIKIANADVREVVNCVNSNFDLELQE